MPHPPQILLPSLTLLLVFAALIAPATLAAQDLVITPRLGIVVDGAGTMDTTCAASMSALGCPDASQDTTDVSALTLGADLLLDTQTGLSLGGGILFQTENTVEPTPLATLPTSDAQPSNPNVPTFIPLTVSGSDLSAFALGEYAIDLSTTTRLIGRLQGGLFMLFVDSELEDIVAESTYTGWTAGGGAGLGFDIQGINLRGDLLFQYFDLPTIDYTLASPTGEGPNLDASFDYSAYRVLLMVGFEFGRS